MGNVQHIGGGEIKNEKNVNDLAVECLESVMENVKDGDVVGVIVIKQHADGATTSSSGGFVLNSRVVGEMMIQVARLTNA